MDWKFKVLLCAMCAILCSLCASGNAFGQTLPDGKGKAEFVHNCTACHHASLVVRVKKTPEDWKKNVFEMAARGTDGSKEDLDNVVTYLVANYATDSPAPAGAAPSSTPPSTSGAASPNASLPSSQLEHIKQIIAENGCLTCHRIGQQGAYTGPTLNGLAAHRTPGEIRAAIVSPPPTLDASHSIVRLTIADGKTLVGRIVSQNDREVQVIDASGQVATYPKPGLHEFTVINTNPMPSYEKKITGEDLDGLVRYLGSLPAVDESVQK